MKKLTIMFILLIAGCSKPLVQQAGTTTQQVQAVIPSPPPPPKVVNSLPTKTEHGPSTGEILHGLTLFDVESRCPVIIHK